MSLLLIFSSHTLISQTSEHAMAVTTGTTWDIVLSNTPVGELAPREGVSPRAAYQAALYGRAVLVDLRSARQRASDGELPGQVATAVVDRLELGVWLRESLASRVFLLDDDGARAGRLASGPDPRVASIEGGFAAWRAAGLPAA